MQLLNRIVKFIYKICWAFFEWQIKAIERNNERETNEIKRKLKYFIPTITTDFWGNKKVNWTLREKPLTDEELQTLIKP